MATSWWEIENADELPTPTVLVYPDRVLSNLDRMIAWTGDPSRLRPHVKTHKLPQIIQMKLARGIAKFKASTIAEVEMVAASGGRDVLLAIQQTGANFRRLLKLIERYPDARLSTIVDDWDHLEWMRGQTLSAGVRVPLFLDLNVGMNRTGIPVGQPAKELYQRLVQWSRDPHAVFEVAGLHVYDGHLHEPDERKLGERVESAFQPVWEFCQWIRSEGYPLPTIVVSGTPTSPWNAGQHREGVEVSAGTTVLWDAGQPRTCPKMDFLNAAILIMRVISRPAPGLLCLDLGYKAVASEMPQPRVQLLGLDDAKAVMHSEEHLVVETKLADRYPVGSILYGIPFHICPTMALHSHVWCVREGRAEERWAVVARDRILTV